MTDYYSYYSDNDYLAHHGVLGMKWGQHIFGRDQKSGTHQSKRAQNKEKIKEGKKKASQATRAAATAPLTVASFAPSIVFGGALAYGGYALAKKFTDNNYKRIADKNK